MDRLVILTLLLSIQTLLENNQVEQAKELIAKVIAEVERS